MKETKENPANRSHSPAPARSAEQFLKHLMYLRSKNNNEHLIEKIKEKEKIRVVFIVYLVSMWKLDNVLKLMMEDDYFEPVIFVAPFQDYSDKNKRKEFNKAISFFSKSDCEVISSWNSETNEFISIDEVAPDLVFFSNPWNYSNGLYYENIYKNYLCCYIVYGIGTASTRSFQQINLPFHNSMWQIYSSNKFELSTYKSAAASEGKNVHLVGAPYLENIIYNESIVNPWKYNDGRKKIIFAPHHTIHVDETYNYKLSNFLDIAEDIKNLAILHQEQTVWSFKPHPNLREKLYNHPDWGKKKTDLYYLFWENSSFTQLTEGEYIGLFKHSDTMIHDSCSFLMEYLALKKPVLYLTSEYTENSLNSLGKKALNACRTAKNKKEIDIFIKKIISNNLEITNEHEKLFHEEFIKLYSNETPSERVIRLIKSNICSNSL